MAMVHIIGAGVSGLAAATQLSAAHVPVRLYEATANAGGRARSSQDPKLGLIDHGLHVISGHSPALHAYLERIGAGASLARAANPNLPPKAPLADYVALLPLLFRRNCTLGALLNDENRLRDLWGARFARAFLHTPLDEVSMQAARRAIWRLLRHPLAPSYVPASSLHESFIAPALALLEYQGTTVYFNHSLKGLERRDGRVTSLTFARQKIAVGPDDIVILATPASATQQLLPEIHAPKTSHASITLHYKTAHREPPQTLHAPSNAPVDTVRYTAGRISLGIRVANEVWHSDPQFLAERLWRWLQKQHLYLAEQPMPAYAIWREKQAGHQLTVDDAPVIPALPSHLFLAGDWQEAHAPASLESAAASGHRAAEATLALLGKTPARAQSPRRP